MSAKAAKFWVYSINHDVLEHPIAIRVEEELLKIIFQIFQKPLSYLSIFAYQALDNAIAKPIEAEGWEDLFEL